MIIDKDTNPTRDVYFLGSELLAVLEQQSAKKIDFFVVFDYWDAFVLKMGLLKNVSKKQTLNQIGYR